ncbi:MAG: hypothetical protein ACWGMZ_00485 [Thermoguttaceae bacterium]
MKPADLFGVVIRSLGLLFLMWGLWSLFLAFLQLLLGGPGNVLSMTIGSIPALFVGIWFLSGAKSLVYLAYQEEFEKEKQAA